jgi:hypothetical protein
LTHGEKTPGIGGDAYEQRDEIRMVTRGENSLCATESRG